jgi:hypothetical protein
MSLIFLMLLMQVKHFFADFYLQTTAQVQTKGCYGNLVGLGHTLEHVLGTMVVLLPFLFIEYPVGLLLLALFDGVVHYHCDFVKMKYGSKNPGEQRFWHEMGMDQLVHQLTYVTITYGVYVLICYD